VLRLSVRQPSHTTSVFGFLTRELFSSYPLILLTASHSSVSSPMWSGRRTRLRYFSHFFRLFCTVFGTFNLQPFAVFDPHLNL